MCGRYMLTTPVDALRQLLLFPERPNLPPRYNIAPTQDVPIVRRTRDGTARELIMVRWGLVPYWADDPKIGNRLINARGESVARTRRSAKRISAGDAWCRRTASSNGRRSAGPGSRCWCARGSGAVRVRRLWERWPQPGGGVLRSCTIITCPANELVAPVHDRMPVILAPEDYERWLDPARIRNTNCSSPTRPLSWRRFPSAPGQQPQ